MVSQLELERLGNYPGATPGEREELKRLYTVGESFSDEKHQLERSLDGLRAKAYVEGDESARAELQAAKARIDVLADVVCGYATAERALHKKIEARGE